jgi:hypothetical protein
MKKYGAVCFVFFTVAVSLPFLSCGNVVGRSIDKNSDLESLFATPRKTVYDVGDSFIPANDLAVFAVYYNGGTQKLPIQDVAITGVEIYPASFAVAGQRDVTVSYGGKQAVFAVLVGSVGSGGSGSGSVGGSGPGIDIGIGWK